MYDFVVVCALMSLCATGLAQDLITINIGGPRKATATISESGDEYEIKVSLIPVRCFDPGMNRRLSQDKARSYATETLIRHVGGGKQQSATISKVEIIEAGIVDTRFVLVMRVPRKSIRLVESQDENPTAKPEDRNARRSLHKAKDDYQETLEVITKTLTDDLPMFNGNVEDFYEAVSDAEELGVTRLESLGKEIKSDRWLLSTERKELLQTVTVEEAHFINRLRKQVEEVENNNKGFEQP